MHRASSRPGIRRQRAPHAAATRLASGYAPHPHVSRRAIAIVLYLMNGRLLALALLATAAASGCSCSSRRPSDHEPSAGQSGEGAAGASGFVSNGGAAAAASGSGGAIGGDDSFRVEARAERNSLCPGECTELSALAQNGVAPITYRWSSSELEGEGPFEICPERSTTYEVTTTDSRSKLGEFGEDQLASDAIEIVVTEDCAEPDGGTDPVEHPPGTLLCELRLPYGTVEGQVSPFSSWAVQRNLVAGHDGKAYFAGSFMGALTIGTQAVSAQNSSGILIEVDADCRPTWVKVFSTVEGQVWLASIAVGEDGDIWVVGSMTGQATFAGGPVGPPTTETGLLMHLDARGELIGAELIGPTGNIPSLLTDVGIMRDGDVAVTGIGPDGMVLAGTAIESGDFSNALPFVARLSRERELRFVRPLLGGSTPLASVIVNGDWIAFATDISTVMPVSIAGTAVDAPLDRWNVVLGVLDGEGDLLWGRTSQTLDVQQAVISIELSPGIDQTIVAETHAIVLEPGASEYASLPPTIERVASATGALLASDDRPNPAGEVRKAATGLGLDAEDNAFVADEIWAGSPTEDGGTFTTNGSSDVLMMKRAPSGEVLWSRQSGDAWRDLPFGIALDDRRGVWIGTLELDDGSGTGTVVISRLAQ